MKPDPDFQQSYLYGGVPTMSDADREEQAAQHGAVDDFYVIRAMAKYGGGFVKALSEAARAADDDNLRRIKKTWPEYWEKYTRFGRNLMEKEKQ
jgi:hypothetical protein